MEYNSQTEIKIIKAATEVFLEKGKDGARMQEIADNAGINKALLHYYFRSKDKLFTLVFKHEFKKVLSKILTLVGEEDDFRKFIQSFAYNYMKSITPRKNLMRFVIWEVGKDNLDVVDIFRESFSKHGFKGNPIVERTKKAIADGQIRSLDPNHFALSLLGMCLTPYLLSHFILKIIPGLDVTDPEFINKRSEEITRLLWDGIKPDTQ